MVLKNHVLQLFLTGFLFFFLIGAAEDQIHHQHLPCNLNADEQNGVILGFLMEVIDEGDQKRPVINDFREEHDHENYQ
jgi:hypothetical protein